MHKKPVIIILAFILTLCIHAQAQYSIYKPNRTQSAPAARQAPAPRSTAQQAAAPTAVPVADMSLDGQYRTLLAKSRSSWGYKMISPDRLAAFYRSVKDTVRTERARIHKLQTQVNQLNGSIKSLNQNITGKESSLEDITNKVNQISFLGIPMNKSLYNTIVWGLIIAFGLGMLITINRAVAMRKEAKHRIQLHQEVSDEYLAFKQKANEKEKKLARELQDERNKLDELRKS